VPTATPTPTPTPAPGPAPDLAAWWKFDETSGAAVADSAGANHGTLFNGASRVPGRFGTAISFNGVNQYLEVPHSSTLHSDRQLTVAGWLRLNSLGETWQGVFWKGNVPDCTAGCENREYSLWLRNDGLLQFASTPADRVGIGQLKCNTSPGRVVTGRWYHVAAIIDSDAGHMKLYVDGIEACSVPYSGAGIRTSTGPFRVGTNPNWASLNGSIDDLRIYRRALTAEEIAALTQEAP
jgi:hypothetical protein